MTRDFIKPGETIGVLGGGQLGRMFALAAHRLGYSIAVFAPEADCPAGAVADQTFEGDYTDVDAVERFARAVRAVTFEFENVPAATADAASRHTLVRPDGSALFVAQDRLREKRKLVEVGLPVAPFEAVESAGDVERLEREWSPERGGVLKTSTSGYDGKGQVRIHGAADLAAAHEQLGRVPAVLEEFIEFDVEISVVGVRGADGEVALYEPSLNRHANHILDVSISPAPIDGPIASAAQSMTRELLEGLGYVGVLCVEFFVLPSGQLLVNEIAPRPHNSGHLTIEGHECSQFEQQVRALCGLPLGSTNRRAPAVAMANLLGDVWDQGEPAWDELVAMPDQYLHLYGKREPRPGRKMGHITSLAGSAKEAEDGVRHARRVLARTRSDGSPTSASSDPDSSRATDVHTVSSRQVV